jgi:endonuclease/exonuclease/phosphatase family metal-dependent hydrolase
MKRALYHCPQGQSAISQLRSRQLWSFFGTAFVAASLSLLTIITGPSASALGDQVSIRVMTQNMYIGSDLSALRSATTPTEFVAVVTQLYQNIVASQPAERAAAVAQEIARERPDLVALQEAWILRSGAAPATNVVSDQLEALLNELRRLGQHYETIAILPNMDAEAPTLLGFDARVTDRTVIIARAGILGPSLKLANMRVQDFLYNQALNTPVGVPIINKRGWASVDATVFGHTFRFVTTHLDVTPPFAIQRAQAAEALQTGVRTTLPTVFLGDFNADPRDDPSNPTFPTYQLLISAGFSDAWKQRYPSLPGFTCCQAADLLNPISTLSVTIDHVLTRGAISVQDIKLVGDRASDRTPSGRWPSDHAGVTATLRIGN